MLLLSMVNGWRAKYFTKAELTRTDHVLAEPDLQSDPPSGIVSALEQLALCTLDPVREYLGVPVTVNDGYRGAELNALVKGALTSQHRRGLAADLKLSLLPGAIVKSKIMSQLDGKINGHTFEMFSLRVPNQFLWLACVLNLKAWAIDQLIFEYGNHIAPDWVHVSHNTLGAQRGEIRHIFKGGDIQISEKQAIMMASGIV